MSPMQGALLRGGRGNIPDTIVDNRISWQWQRQSITPGSSWDDISDAQSQFYRIASGDMDHRIRLRAHENGTTVYWYRTLRNYADDNDAAVLNPISTSDVCDTTTYGGDESSSLTGHTSRLEDDGTFSMAYPVGNTLSMEYSDSGGLTDIAADRHITYAGEGVANNYGRGILYKWDRLNDDDSVNQENIGADSTYLIQPDDEGFKIRGSVTYKDDQGCLSTHTETSGVVVSNISNSDATGMPFILFDDTGLSAVGQTVVSGQVLRYDLGTISDANNWDGMVHEFQWQQQGKSGNFENITMGGNSETYTVGPATVSSDIFRFRLRVRFRDADYDSTGHTEELFSGVTGFINVPPGGTPQVGATDSLTEVGNDMMVVPADQNTFIANLADPNGPVAPFAYRWEKCGRGQSCGAEGADWEALLNIEADPDTTDPADDPFMGDSFTLLDTHAGYRFRYFVSYTDEDGNDEVARSAISEPVNSPVRGSVAIVFRNPRNALETPYTRTPEVGETLQADTSGISDANGLGSFSYRWFREDRNGDNRERISGNNRQRYSLREVDAGKRISLEVRLRDNDGFEETPGAAAATDLVNDVGRGLQVHVQTLPNIPVDNPPDPPGYEVGGALAHRLYAPAGGLRDANEERLPASRFASAAWEWARVNSDGVAIIVSGETENIYTLTPADAGMRIRATVRYTDVDLFAETVSATSEVVNALAIGSPTISGPDSPEPGSVLTTDILSVADSNGFNRANARLTWMRLPADGIGAASDIAGAHGTTYILQDNDANRRIMVRVDFTDDDGFAESRPSATVYPDGGAAPVNGRATGAPILEGTAKVDAEISVNTGGIDDINGLTLPVEYTYAWTRLNADGSNPVVLSGETSERYTLVKADEGRRIQVQVSFDDDEGYPNEIPSTPSLVVERRDDSAPQGLPAISVVEDCGVDTAADLKVGKAVKANMDGVSEPVNLMTNAVPSYQWVRLDADYSNSRNIGVDSDCYTLLKADEAKRLQVVVSYIDDDGYSTTVRSEPTGASVARRDDELTEDDNQAPPTVSGGVQVDGVLTADTSNIEDSNGLASATMRYQWERLDSPADQTPILLGESESPVYIPVKADEGKYLRLTVLFNDDDGYLETRTGRLLGPVGRRGNLEATGRPAIRGAMRVGETLSAVPGSIEDGNGVPDASEFTWQWFRQDANGRALITQATGYRYTVTPEDSEKQLLVRAEFLDLDKYQESMFSAPTGLVTEIAAVRASGLTHLLSGLGRTLSISLVDVVWERIGSLEAWRDGPRTTASLGGRAIDTEAFSAASDAGRAAKEVVGLLGLEAVSPESMELGVGQDSTAGGGFDDYLDWAGLPSSRDLLGGSRISMPLDEAARAGEGNLSIWAQGDMGAYERARADSEFSEANSKGTMMAGHLGLEYVSPGGGLLGVAISHSLGEAEYEFADVRHSDATVETVITSAMPYLYFRSEGGAGIWGAYGQGAGTLDLTDDVSDVETDISLKTTAAGFHGGSLPFGDVDLRLKADYFRTDVVADEVGDGSELMKVDTFSSRARLVLEGTVQSFSDSGGRATGKFELGARMDEGDVGEGMGAEAAAEVRVGSGGLELRGRGSVLFFHEQKGYREWGASLGLIYDPGRSGRGVSLTLEPSWNAPRTGVASAMWDSDSLSGHRERSNSGDVAAIRARLGYGVGALQESGLVTLYSEVENDEDARRLRLGSEFDGLRTGLGALQLDLYGERRDSAAAPVNAVMFEGSIGF